MRGVLGASLVAVVALTSCSKETSPLVRSDSPTPPAIVGTPPSRVNEQISFSGHVWNVTHQPEGSGPTTVGGFSGRHAWVDDDGHLNLRLERIDGEWQGGAVVSERKGWGYGTYEWTVETRIDGFDENAVVGLFTYEPDAPGNREIDIEIARFGRASGTRNMYSVLYYEGGESYSQNWTIGAQRPTTHAFTWQPKWVTWVARDANGRIIHRARAPTSIGPGDARVHMNIWVCCEASPARPQHVVISSFEFTPAT